MSIAFEDRVWFDADEAVTVARLSTIGAGFAFALQSDLHSVIDAGWYFDFDLDFFGLDTASPAVATSFGNDATGSLALRAGCLNAEDSSRLDDLPLSTTLFAGCGGGSRFGSGSIAGSAALMALKVDFAFDA